MLSLSAAGQLRRRMGALVLPLAYFDYMGTGRLLRRRHD
jgi:hypothetical protein